VRVVNMQEPADGCSRTLSKVILQSSGAEFGTVPGWLLHVRNQTHWLRAGCRRLCILLRKYRLASDFRAIYGVSVDAKMQTFAHPLPW